MNKAAGFTWHLAVGFFRTHVALPAGSFLLRLCLYNQNNISQAPFSTLWILILAGKPRFSHRSSLPAGKAVYTSTGAKKLARLRPKCRDGCMACSFCVCQFSQSQHWK